MGKILAGDIVFHKPSGETWLVCGVHEERNELIPCGWPFPSMADLSDCDFVEKGNGQSEEMRDVLKKHGLDSFIEGVEI